MTAITKKSPPPLRVELLIIIPISIVFVILRLPSLIEPSWYGDEGIYQVIGMALSKGEILYKQIWDNKPPLLYLLYAFVQGDLFMIRLVSVLIGLATVIIFYLLTKRLFNSSLSRCIASLVFTLLFGLPLLEGNIANAENFMLLPILFAFYILDFGKPQTSYFAYILAGFAMSCAFLLKVVGIFDFAALLLLLIYFRYQLLHTKGKTVFDTFNRIIQDNIFSTFSKEIIYIIAFAIPIVSTCLYFIIVGAFPDFLRATLLQNIGYVGYGNTSGFPINFLFIKTVLLAGIISVLIYLKRYISTSSFIIFIWLSFSLYNAFFSQRPYLHYLLVLIPTFSLCIGVLFQNIKQILVNSIVIVVVFFLITSTFTFYRKTTAYYTNYIHFITGKKGVEAYQSFFDRNTPRDYDIANFIQANTKASEEVFLWSDSAQIYALANKLPVSRYIVAYHMTFYKNAIIETKTSVRKHVVKYIISTKNSSELKEFLQGYQLHTTIRGADVYERQP